MVHLRCSRMGSQVRCSSDSMPWKVAGLLSLYAQVKQLATHFDPDGANGDFLDVVDVAERAANEQKPEFVMVDAMVDRRRKEMFLLRVHDRVTKAKSRDFKGWSEGPKGAVARGWCEEHGVEGNLLWSTFVLPTAYD